MKPYLIAFFVAVAYARPEPPAGYNYPNPTGPIIDFGGLVPGNSGALGHGGGGPISSGFDASSSFSSGNGAGIGGGFGGGALGGAGLDGSYGAPAAGPTVHKHVYVHVAPEEPEERRPPKVIPVGAAQKHYKIIFIKAPNPPTPTAPVIPVQPQNEEKTLVYVLVKKPEEQPEIVVPTPAPTQPSKPEVYFIRYKTQKDGGAGGYPSGGPGAPSLAGAGAGAGLSGVGGDLSGANLGINHGGSLGGDTGSFASSSAGASSQYGPPGYHK